MRAHSSSHVTSFVTERDGVRWRKILHLTGCDVSDAVRTTLALDISMSKLSENLFGHDKCVNVNASTDLWACRMRWKAARPVPNWLHVLRRCIQLGTVGRPEAGHDFSICCHWNILPQCWIAARVCIHLGAVCHVGVLCCRSRVGFHRPTGHIHLHLQTDTFIIWQSITRQCICDVFMLPV
jgi:hypothetical protein